MSSADTDHSASVFCGARLLIANSRGQVICYDPLTQNSSRALVSKEQSDPYRISSNERWAMVTFASGQSSYTSDGGATWTIVAPYTQLRDAVALGVDPGQAIVFSQGIGRDVGGGLSRALQSGFTRVIHAAVGADNSVLVTHGRTWRLIRSTLSSGWKRVSMGIASDMFAQRVGDDYVLAGEHGVWRLPIGTESLRCLFPENTANVAIDSSRDRLLAGGYGGRVVCVGASTGERRWEFQRADVGTAMVALGSRVAFVGGTDGSVTALDAETGRELWMTRDHRRRVRGMSAVADCVVTASASPGLLVYDIAGKMVGRCGIAEARCVAVASDARRYFCGTDRGTVASGDTSARIPRGEVSAHSGGVWSVAVNAAGTIGASGGGDGIVRLWWLDPLTPLAKFEISSDSASLVCDMHFSDDSRKLLCTVNEHGAYELDLSRHEHALEDWLTKDRYFTFSGGRDQMPDGEPHDVDAGDQ